MRESVFIVALMSAACITPEMRNKVATMADLRERNGACAIGDYGSFTSPASVIACAQTGSPGTLDDDGSTPYLVSKFQSDSFELSNPGNWQFTVSESGRELIKLRLPADVPNVGVCGSWGCFKDGIAITPLPEPWKPGKYTLRYVCAFDTRRVATMTITLR